MQFPSFLKINNKMSQRLLASIVLGFVATNTVL
jgi:hypothetical protein